MRKLTRNILILTLLLSALLGALSVTYFGYRAETLVWDQWFELRYRLFGKQQIDPRLVIVGIDEHTIAHMNTPSVLWQGEFAKLIQKLKEGQPAVIGLDIVSRPFTGGLPDDDSLKQRVMDDALALGLVAAEPPPVILIEVYQEDFIEFDKFDDNPEERKSKMLSPHELVVDLLTDENGDAKNLAIANLAKDTDGSIRRAKLFTRMQNSDKTERADNLAFRMLDAIQEQNVELSRGNNGEANIRWNGIDIPFLFDESFLINFPGPVEDNDLEPLSPSKSVTFPQYSAKAFLAGEVDPKVLKDKIVLIAPSATSLNDLKVVPGDNQYPGGTVHLAVLNMFLTNSFVSRPILLWLGFPIVLALLGFAIGRRGKVTPGVLLGLSVPIIGFGSFCLLLVWCPVIFPFFAAMTGCALGYIERLLTIERDRARVRSTFARMVSPQVMNHVLANYNKLKNGERKEVTVLFSDINDFTPICEQHTPEEVIHMLSDYFSNMVDVIMKYDGYLKQYVGDEIMVIYGAPDDSDDHATRAVLTALEMRDALAKAKRDSNGKPGFYEVKIGVNTGSVVVGKVGPETRWEYAAVGDNVNLGARVMSVAKNLGMDIGISAATKARFDKEREQGTSVSDKIKWASQGVQSFKGKISQMEVFGIERED